VSEKYKIFDNDKAYFISFTVIGWGIEDNLWSKKTRKLKRGVIPLIFVEENT
jgi:hypothetical protein